MGMIDRKKLIEQLKTDAIATNTGYVEVPLFQFSEIIALLKEQEAVEPRVSTAEQRCGNCNKVIEMDGWKVCPLCGKPILWEAVGRSVKRDG